MNTLPRNSSTMDIASLIPYSSFLKNGCTHFVCRGDDGKDVSSRGQSAEIDG